MSASNWNWDSDYYDLVSKESEYVPDDWCNHSWTPTQLIFSTVYDCCKCGKKKEECE